MKLPVITIPVESSMLVSLTPVPSQDVLIAEFKNNDKYIYFGVGHVLIDQIIDAEPVGKEFNAVIKAGGFDYLKL